MATAAKTDTVTVSEENKTTAARAQKDIDQLSMMECDTPVYDDFVKDFLETNAGPGKQPLAKIARKLWPTWPIPEPPSGSKRKTAVPNRTVRVGVMDSSFNPPHYCHAAYMECLGIRELMSAAGTEGQSAWKEAQVLGIDAYLLLLGSENADKELEGATLEQRMRMVDMLATTIACDMAADTWHLWKSKEQFEMTNLHNMAIGMVNTPLFVDKCKAVKEMVRKEWGESSIGKEGNAEKLEVLSYFGMGWDALIRFFDPKYYAHYPREIEDFFASGGRIAYSRRTGFPDDDVDAFFRRTDISDYLQYIFELKLPKRVKHISSTDVRIAVRDSTQSVRDIPPRILEYVNSCQLYRSEIFPR
ncbi:hypothetical protein GGI25_005139 [Coemansia spiralis]|uniref:Nicotinamide-nucleotide adenylyltransferase n=2 Tax=Coemansia TaxID=4863 RepID=A0A9W8KVZ4_9FUNG|nr:hypothetical protein BX070DRAFT_80895 [Coemansia spiralis]KAJ1988779.1 hypothetical protein EDC05_005070 [Coemansia umbellata]KAJ2620034.1 hypothetical protein GGI26_005328 [Coemansia sp. RSA 1358]KAJ2672377.1 hypothetical protein GGI25_005139 [Coemansia spiralis]